MKRRAAQLIAILVLSSIVFPILASAENTESRNQPIKIGFLNDATGPIAVYGPGFESAALKAIMDLNSDGGNFEIVFADSGCDGEMAGTAAQSLVDAGVVAVAGAACSGASMGANSVLSAAGIPQISYASTSPALTDAAAYPGFFRVVPSDASQGQAMAAVATADGQDNIAVLHMTNSYGSGLADSFVANMDAAHICTQIGYEQTTTDFAAAVESVIDFGCTSVFLVSYAPDGAMIIEEMASQGYSGAIYGGDGVAEEGLAAGMSDNSLVDGVIATKPAPGNITNSSLAFSSWCSNNSYCYTGIYTAQAYDAVKLIGESYNLAQNLGGIQIEYAIHLTGYRYEGASGHITFDMNGDQSEVGFYICEFEFHPSNNSVSLLCPQILYLNSPVQNWNDSDGDGVPDLWDPCPNDFEGTLDTDSDGVCNNADSDDDGDGTDDWADAFPLDPSEDTDTDNDGVGNNADDDDDGDGYDDWKEQECNSDKLDPSSTPQDTDDDGWCDFIDDDDDNDFWSDYWEILCGFDPLNNLSIPIDYDSDGWCDFYDLDDDDDGIADVFDAFPFNSQEWYDTDLDGIGNNADFDDDGDSWADIHEVQCGYDPLNHNSTPPDLDLDNECDELDRDDDGDMILDDLDDFPMDKSEWSDSDQDGVGNNVDDDDDNDLWKDIVELNCGSNPLNISSTPHDFDGDGICDVLDEDDDDDGYYDIDEVINCGESNDPFDVTSIPTDTDGDYLCNAEDGDDDGDGVGDYYDAFPLDNSETSDYDGDGIGDNADTDDDNDGTLDELDKFPFDSAEWLDTDSDGIGNNVDLDDDADMLSDMIELQIGTDPLNEDTDGDGFYDSVDDLPLNSAEWSDIDGDGVGDNSDAFPSIARYHTIEHLLFDVVILILILISMVTLVVTLRGRNKN
tara:strand:+ start:116 stop:2827 length:2712 start_codon:yes stop_codon:yes gene_type:complete